ncbi:hypothetical protein EMCG_05467 [[Emmonsia] crescens]|uniref:Uncharacterized protein n=1 Tax=[Emmonsia] crescens TaxID=73230 RepID=A0A0G2HPZ0_9EURO|nr:hypothetical protein EMCG_05467 [Emmonsia crescens UAMH 3008]
MKISRLLRPASEGQEQNSPSMASTPVPSTLEKNVHVSPAKKQGSKWSKKEDELLTELRGHGMKWDDISTRLPGRSTISCHLHYQNYLEKHVE